MDEWLEAFTIFSRHGAKNHDICAEHDEVFVHVAQPIAEDSDDAKRLAELRWRNDDGEGGSWQHFV